MKRMIIRAAVAVGLAFSIVTVFGPMQMTYIVLTSVFVGLAVSVVEILFFNENLNE